MYITNNIMVNLMFRHFAWAYCMLHGRNGVCCLRRIGSFSNRLTVISQDVQIWLDNVVCSGTESSIIDCRHSSFGVHNCGHSEDVHLACMPSTYRFVIYRVIWVTQVNFPFACNVSRFGTTLKSTRGETLFVPHSIPFIVIKSCLIQYVTSMRATHLTCTSKTSMRSIRCWGSRCCRTTTIWSRA